MCATQERGDAWACVRVTRKCMRVRGGVRSGVQAHAGGCTCACAAGQAGVGACLCARASGRLGVARGLSVWAEGRGASGVVWMDGGGRRGRWDSGTGEHRGPGDGGWGAWNGGPSASRRRARRKVSSGVNRGGVGPVLAFHVFSPAGFWTMGAMTFPLCDLEIRGGLDFPTYS